MSTIALMSLLPSTSPPDYSFTTTHLPITVCFLKRIPGQEFGSLCLHFLSLHWMEVFQMCMNFPGLLLEHIFWKRQSNFKNLVRSWPTRMIAHLSKNLAIIICLKQMEPQNTKINYMLDRGRIVFECLFSLKIYRCSMGFRFFLTCQSIKINLYMLDWSTIVILFSY